MNRKMHEFSEIPSYTERQDYKPLTEPSVEPLTIPQYQPVIPIPIPTMNQKRIEVDKKKIKDIHTEGDKIVIELE